MAKETLLGPEKAWGRWNAMRKAPRPKEFDNAAEHTISVPLNTLTVGNDVATLRDEDWNFRTLTMMVHAGMLRFSHALPRTKSDDDLGDQEGNAIAATPYAHVTIMHTDHLHKDPFFKRFSQARTQRTDADKRDVARLHALIEGTRSVHDLLRETYTIRKAKVTVPATSGDCPKSRREGRARHDRGFPVLVRPSDTPTKAVHEFLLRLFRELPHAYHGPLLVGYEASAGWSFSEDLRELAERLATLGVVEFAWPESDLGALDWVNLSTRAPGHYVFAADSADDPALEPWQVPRLSIVTTPDAEQLKRTLGIVRPHHVVLVPAGLDDPHTPYRRFDARTHMTLSAFLERIRPR